jgi:diguanylate cyclase (GGDEF)-like protein/PAS domain S-box-containing protein
MDSKRSVAPQLWKIALALVIVAAAHLLRLFLLRQFGFELSPYLTFLPVIMAVALLLGFWPGLAATIATGLIVDLAIIEPKDAAQPAQKTADLTALALSALVCVTFCLMAEYLRKSRSRLLELESEHALHETRAKLQAALESSAEAIFICDVEGNFVEFNQAFAAFHKFKNKSECPRHFADYPGFMDVFFPDGTPAPPEQWVVPRALRGEQATGVEYRQRRKDTGEQWVGSFNFAPIRDREGRIVGCVFSALDITSEKRAEDALRSSEARYRTAFQTSADAMVITSFPDCRCIEVNGRFTECFGYTRDEAIGKTAAELGLWANPADHDLLINAYREGKEYRDVQAEFRKRDGSTLWGNISATPLTIDGEECLLTSVRDITREKQTEDALRSSEARYRAAFETSPDVIVISRVADGMYMDVNPSFTTVTGWRREEVVGKSSQEFDIWVDYGNRDAMMEVIAKGESFRGIEIQFRRKNGTTLWGAVFATTIEVNGEPCFLVQVRDVSHEKKVEEEIRNLAFYDQVTGLANRRLLVEQFRKSIALSSRTHRKRALIFLDLDNFKNVNETRNHHIGDLLLRAVANRLLECVNPADTVARLGGDEFVLILEELHGYPEIAATQAMGMAEKILHRVAQPYLLEEVEVRTSCSIGITVFGDNQADFNHVLQQADIAMYQAKAAGRNSMRFFAPGLQAAVTARATLEEEMRQGLESKQFILYFQPQYERGRLYGAEALVRWRHPKQGMIAPGEFIPLAEETRLILPLGAWVLETACRQIASWANRCSDFGLTIAVNISAIQLRRDDFVTSVLDAVTRTGANPKWLKLELTESLLVDNAEDAIAKMTALKEHGIRFALDDFGTGYSSLAYLKRLPLSQLKIDRSFVRDLLTDPTSSAIASTIIALSRELGLHVLAEGVETSEQRAALEQLGCFLHQGFLYGAPLPPEEFEQLLLQCAANPALQPV